MDIVQLQKLQWLRSAHRLIFWTAKDEGTLNHKSKTRYPTGAATQAKRSSRTTSFPEGMEAPVPGLGRLSRRDRAKALPALHARMELLLNHAAFTRFCSRSGTDSAFAFASFGGNGPSHQTTDPQSQQLRPPDGLVHPLPPTPGMWSLSCAALPPEPRRRALRLPSSDSHQAIESSHVEVAHEGIGGHPSPSLAAHLGCSTLKRNPPAFSKPLPRSTLLDDGQTGRVGGHIGMTVGLDPTLYQHLERHHSVSEKRKKDLIDIVQLQKLQWLRSAHRSCTQFVTLVGIGRVSRARCSSTIARFGSALS